MLPSHDVAKYFPLGLKSMSVIVPVWPFKVVSSQEWVYGVLESFGGIVGLFFGALDTVLMGFLAFLFASLVTDLVTKK